MYLVASCVFNSLDKDILQIFSIQLHNSYVLNILYKAIVPPLTFNSLIFSPQIFINMIQDY